MNNLELLPDHLGQLESKATGAERVVERLRRALSERKDRADQKLNLAIITLAVNLDSTNSSNGLELLTGVIGAVVGFRIGQEVASPSNVVGTLGLMGAEAIILIFATLYDAPILEATAGGAVIGTGLSHFFPRNIR